ncbi:hypothetical protein [Polynucleobacter sp. AP-Melu-500A-A1]|uniref:hypothetical protein n=1 Tax=Polynucleobacter sp. AP-Melu-500A-A1 TaxID=2576929 RepID=UPI001C0D90A9|nr:hypothetical protein [Polynucleobacter sp. AP-Melu-500A-A1]MBU3631010.1 hypothetical protein [Polynucleobacter sp. AP-Melu-500A-A1]
MKLKLCLFVIVISALNTASAEGAHPGVMTEFVIRSSNLSVFYRAIKDLPLAIKKD